MKDLTKKQKAFVHYLIDKPKASGGEAAMQTYQAKNRNVARVIAKENLMKPNIQNYLAKYDNTAQETIVDIMNNSRELKEEPQHANIALRAADSILDRVHGKATQKIEQHSTSVNLNLDLTQVTDEE